MTDQSAGDTGFRIFRVGTAVPAAKLNHWVIQLDDPDAEPMATPTMCVANIYGQGTGVVCSEALYDIQPAASFQALAELSPRDPLLANIIFSMISLYANVGEIAITLSDFDGFIVTKPLDGTPDLIGHWIYGTPGLGIAQGWDVIQDADRSAAANSAARRVLPSDLLYAITILCTYRAIGADKFVIRWDYNQPDDITDTRGQVVVAFNDIDSPNLFFGQRFPVGGKL